MRWPAGSRNRINCFWYIHPHPAGSTGLVQSAFTLKVPYDKEYEVVLTGMEPGFWHVAGGRLDFNVNVMAGKNTVFFKAKGGEYIITPGREYEEKGSK